MSKKKFQEQENPLANIQNIVEKAPEEKKSFSRIKQRRAAPEKITIMLYEDQVEWIDKLITEARKGGGKRMRRPEIVRPILDYIRQLEPDLRGVTSEEEVIERLEEAIANSQRRK